MDNVFLKKQLIGEMAEAIRFKELNIEFMEQNYFLINWLLRHCEKNNIKPPNLDKIEEIVGKCTTIMNKMTEIYPSISPTESQQRNKTPDDETEPKISKNS